MEQHPKKSNYMSIEQLLQPRYKVNEYGYPDMPFKTREIIVLSGIDKDHKAEAYWLSTKALSKWYQPFFNRFPNIFIPLPWWKERGVDDMPEYMKFTRNYHSRKKGEVVKVLEYGDGIFLVGTKEPVKIEYFNLGSDTFPATLEEYTNYQNKKS